MRATQLLAVILVAALAYGANCGAKLPERDLPPAEGEGEGEGAGEGEGEGAGEGEGEGEGPAEGEGEGPAEGEGEGECPWPLLTLRPWLEGAGVDEVDNAHVVFFNVDVVGGGPEGPVYGWPLEVMPITLAAREDPAEADMVWCLPAPPPGHYVRLKADMFGEGEGGSAGDVLPVEMAAYEVGVFIDGGGDGEYAYRGGVPYSSEDELLTVAPDLLLVHLAGEEIGPLAEYLPGARLGWNQVRLDDGTGRPKGVEPWEAPVELPVHRLPEYEREFRVELTVEPGAQHPANWRPAVALAVGDPSSVPPFKPVVAALFEQQGDRYVAHLRVPDLRKQEYDGLFDDPVWPGLATALFVLFDDVEPDGLFNALGEPCLDHNTEVWDVFARESRPEYVKLGLIPGHNPMWFRHGMQGALPFEPNEGLGHVELHMPGMPCGTGPMEGEGEPEPEGRVHVRACVQGPQLPEARAGGDAVVVHNENAIYYIGGETAEGDAADTILVMSRDEAGPGDFGWRLIPKPMPSVRIGFGAAVLDDGVYLVGGTDPDTGRPTGTVSVFDPGANPPDWRGGARSLNRGATGLTGSVAGVGGDKVFVVGGLDVGAPSGRVDYYDNRGGQWHNHWGDSEARSGTAVALHGDWLYAFGGLGNRGVLDWADRFGMHDAARHAQRALDPAVYGAEAVSNPDDGNLYLIGGRTSHDQPGVDQVVHRFLPDPGDGEGEWQQVGGGFPTMEGAQAVYFDGLVYVIGGWNDRGVTQDVVIGLCFEPAD